VLAMLRPTWVTTTSKRQTATLLVLFDTSRSMLQPHTSASDSRWQAQSRTIAESVPALARLAEEMEVAVYAYDQELMPIAFDGAALELPEAPEGDQTDIGGTLFDSLSRQRGKRVAAVVLLGDGSQTAYAPAVELQQAAAELARLGAPMLAVPFGRAGDAGQAGDVAVENMPDEYSVFVNNELPVRASLRVRGYVNAPLGVQLVLRDEQQQEKVVAGTQVVSRQDGELLEVSLNYTPREVGRYELTLRAEPQPGELVTSNNEHTAFLTVREGGLRILYLEGELRPEQAFLRRAVDASDDIELEFRWIDHRLRDTWPLKLANTFAGDDYDAFIIGDLDSDALDRESLQALADAVAKGKGLLTLGGYHSYGPGGYQNTPLREALPVVMGERERQDFGTRIFTDMHVAGPLAMMPTGSHFVTRLAPDTDENAAVWRALPELDGANKVSVKPSAQVLASAGPAVPLLVHGQYGDGRVLSFLGDSTWHWYMEGNQDRHKRFWRQAMLWLTGREDATDELVWLRLSQRRLNPGGRVQLSAGARSASGEAVMDADYTVSVHLPDGTTGEVLLTRDGDNVTAAFDETTQAGKYTVEVTARRGTQAIGSMSQDFLVFDHDVELSNPAADPDQLARLAEVTRQWGGKVVSPEDLADELNRLEPPELTIETQEKWQLAGNHRDAWLLFLLLVGLLTGEWVMRKRWGLV